jgi:REP element-mobilizing transposase RayT
MKTFYRRNLPHIQLPEATYFVTFRLTDTLPEKVISHLKQEYLAACRELDKTNDREKVKEKYVIAGRNYFDRFDDMLDKWAQKNDWLRNPQIADLVSEAIHYRDGKEFELLCYCIMSNHVHMVIHVQRSYIQRSGASLNDTKDDTPLYKILQSLKSYTAREANKMLNRTGAFWQHENYDHVIRNDKEMEHYIRYTLDNPVKAGLVKDWEDWQWSYCKYYHG